MRQVAIPIGAGGEAANADIAIPGGLEFSQVAAAWEFVGSDGTAASYHASWTIEAKGDGNPTGAGKAKLQADGKVIRFGDALSEYATLFIEGELAGQVQGYGDGT